MNTFHHPDAFQSGGRKVSLADAVDALNPDELTPKQALEALYRLKQLR